MPFRTWMYVFATGITIASSVQAQEQTQSTEENPTIQSGPAKPDPVGIPIRIIEDGISADARDQSEREAAEREKDDLSAQERMADATEAMNEATQSMKNAAWWSFGAVALGTLLLGYTLKLTRAATKSAQSAVDITRDIGQKQVRAYIYLKDCRIDGIAEGQKATALLNFANSGQSPCYITATSIGIGFEPTPIKTIPSLAPETKLTPSSEGAGAEFSHTISTKHDLSAEAMASYAAGAMGFVVTCEIIYKDVFGHERETTVSVYRTVHNPADANGLSTMSIGNKHT